VGRHTARTSRHVSRILRLVRRTDDDRRRPTPRRSGRGRTRRPSPERQPPATRSP
jgi:hypothetical protein